MVINTYSTEFLNVLNDLRSLHRQPIVSQNEIRDKFLTLAEISPNDQIIENNKKTENDIITGKIQLKIEFDLSIMEAINAIQKKYGKELLAADRSTEKFAELSYLMDAPMKQEVIKLNGNKNYNVYRMKYNELIRNTELWHMKYGCSAPSTLYQTQKHVDGMPQVLDRPRLFKCPYCTKAKLVKRGEEN